MSTPSLLWHDYETWGLDPRRDRVAQFAAVRTDLNLEIIEEPIKLYCRPTGDFIPHPESVLITGITPQKAEQEGINEADFFQQIYHAFIQENTCGVGYNSIRFDDEVTRFGFYRNFIDSYVREWKNHNSRWDIIDLVRMTHALRPEGIQWPIRDDGQTSFRLEDLSKANDIEHSGAHDALSDVYATLGLARLVKKNQPRLYNYYFKLRRKKAAVPLLNLKEKKVVLHASGMYPNALGCIAPIMPLLQHPLNKNEFIVFDLRQNPDLLMSMTKSEMAKNLYTRKEDRAEGEVRVALKGIHVNKSPALAPVKTLSAEYADKWQINWTEVEQHRQQLLKMSNRFRKRLVRLYLEKPEYKESDIDAALYSGFVSTKDRKKCDQVLSKTPEELSQWTPKFNDLRLQALYFRYRARNWPESLTAEEKDQWQIFCQTRNEKGEYGATLTLDAFQQLMDHYSTQKLSERYENLLKQLQLWVAS